MRKTHQKSVVELLGQSALDLDCALEKLAEYVPPTPEAEDGWNNFWKPICTFRDGSINLEQIKKELADYRMILGNVSKVYEHVTCGRISKPNTDADAVIAEADDRCREYADEAIKEALEDERHNQEWADRMG